MKKFYESRTFWLALVQLIIGVLTVIAGILENPSLTLPGVLVIIKSLTDMWLRFRTDSGIEI